MLDILFYLLDSQYEPEIVAAMGDREYIYHHAFTSEEVIQVCQREYIDLIVVWPARQALLEDLLTLLNMNNLSYLPVIAVVTSEKETAPLLELPLSEVIVVPTTKKEFFHIIENTIRDVEGEAALHTPNRWKGDLGNFNLIDLIQMVGANGKDAILSIQYHDLLGQIFFRTGKVVRATLRNFDTLTALHKLVGLRKGTFQVQFARVDLADSLELSNEELIIELLQYLTRQEQAYRELPGLFEEIVLNPRAIQDTPSQDQIQILQHFDQGTTINDLLLMINEDNIEVLDALQEMFAKGWLIRSQDLDVLQKEELESKKLGSLFQSLTNLFKREKKEESLPATKPANQSTIRKTVPEIEVQTPPLEEEVLLKIENKLGTI